MPRAHEQIAVRFHDQTANQTDSNCSSAMHHAILTNRIMILALLVDAGESLQHVPLSVA